MKSVSQAKLPYFEGIFKLWTHEKQDLPFLQMIIIFEYQNLAVLCVKRPWNKFRFSWNFYMLYEVCAPKWILFLLWQILTSLTPSTHTLIFDQVSSLFCQFLCIIVPSWLFKSLSQFSSSVPGNHLSSQNMIADPQCRVFRFRYSHQMYRTTLHYLIAVDPWISVGGCIILRINKRRTTQ